MAAERLTDRFPEVSPEELIDSLVPPPRFGAVSFANYVPNPDEPSQAAAVAGCQQFAGVIGARRTENGFLKLFKSKAPVARPGLYLDGGFGVGKTHLLASLWHLAPGPKAYGTFVEITNLVGALGFREAVTRLSEHRLLAIDEFELDDPGDTTLVTRLLTELTDAGVFVAATSNTLPDKLGEGRFAADDFLREIQTLSAKFGVIRVDGPDYRHRGLPAPPEPMPEDQLYALADRIPGATLDQFEVLCHHLARIHPSRYGRLVAGLPAVCLREVSAAPDQNVALRLVAFADRLYDAAIPVAISGESLSRLFTESMLRGGYRKKYLRALSRLAALNRDAQVKFSAPVS
ncbi:cell division protein ZapE [Pseudonocardiaceae bacterium YIM PH 21723]|nr:cell division protein ZapE [Pseudonocardiaceae bacterium YIM PH 21723]